MRKFIPQIKRGASVGLFAPRLEYEDKVKARTGSVSEALDKERQHKEQFKAWWEQGSDDLRDAWVSVCPLAGSHDVADFQVADIVEAIRTGGPVKVCSRDGARTVDLERAQHQIVRLYQAGGDEANETAGHRCLLLAN